MLSECTQLASCVWQGRKIRSATAELVAHRKLNSKSRDPAVAQTTDIVTSHTGDKWTEHSGGLYPYLKTKRGKNVNTGKDNIHSSVQPPAPNGNAVSGVEMTRQDEADHGGAANDSVAEPHTNGVTLV